MCSTAKEEPRELLPTNVRPVHYDLCMQPDLAQRVFSGKVSIVLDVKQATQEVVANAHDLTFRSACIEGGAAATAIELDADIQRVRFGFEQELPVGRAVLIIEFDGILNDKMAGFYASTYEEAGVQKTMAVTQFEAVDARRAFPCWDEPALKATFSVSLIVNRDLVAVSNMPEASSEDFGAASCNLVKRTFEKTPIMSTYLLAFVVGEFDMIEKHTADGVAVRVYTPRGKSVQGEFGLDVAVKCLEFYNGYFEIPYPLPKLDLLAIPDFAAGAMENWGCVTYRSTALLVDPENSSTNTKQWVALVVAHELAHQWFGNLVTMVWWTDLWLNEGFATWVEYLATNHLFPDWKIWTQFVYMDFGRALQLDALTSSHPIEVPISRAQDVDEIFDHISYAKGSSVIRMLVNYLGEEVFRVGIVKYLKMYQYGNAATDQLWEVLAQSSGKPVGEIMQCWTRQQGYPVLNVSSGDSANQLQVIQKRFLVDGIPEGTKDTWTLPILLTSSAGSTSEAHMLSDTQGCINVPEGAEWVKLNPGQCGIYRVLYDNALFEKLKTAVCSQALSDPADRLGVQNDAIALARAGLLPTVDVMKLLLSYSTETNYTVWADLLTNNFNELKTLLMHTDMYEKFKLFGQEVLGAIVEKLGWDVKEEDDHLTSLLRSLVISKIGVLGHQATVEEACRRFDAFQSSGFKAGLHADLRSGVYATVLAERKQSMYDVLLSLYRTAELHEEKVRVLGVLGHVPDLVLLQKTLDFSFTNEVRSQDVMYSMGSVAANSRGSELAWTFLKNNWNMIVEKYGSGFTIGRLISLCTTCFSTQEKANEVRQFFEEHRAPGGERSVKQSIEKIEAAAAWLKRDGESIRAFLESRY